MCWVMTSVLISSESSFPAILLSNAWVLTHYRFFSKRTESSWLRCGHPGVIRSVSCFLALRLFWYSGLLQAHLGTGFRVYTLFHPEIVKYSLSSLGATVSAAALLSSASGCLGSPSHTLQTCSFLRSQRKEVREFSLSSPSGELNRAPLRASRQNRAFNTHLNGEPGVRCAHLLLQKSTLRLCNLQWFSGGGKPPEALTFVAKPQLGRSSPQRCNHSQQLSSALTCPPSRSHSKLKCVTRNLPANRSTRETHCRCYSP